MSITVKISILKVYESGYFNPEFDREWRTWAEEGARMGGIRNGIIWFEFPDNVDRGKLVIFKLRWGGT